MQRQQAWLRQRPGAPAWPRRAAAPCQRHQQQARRQQQQQQQRKQQQRQLCAANLAGLVPARSAAAAAAAATSGPLRPRSTGSGTASRRRSARAAAASGDRSEPAASASLAGVLVRAGALLDALYRFSRPHTMAGTFVSVVSVSAMAMQGLPWGAAATAGLAQALSAALLMNVAIVGINQLYDIEIDKVNKPYLPLASGDLTPAQGAGVVALCTAASLAVGLASGSGPLLATLALSLLLGVLYSTELPFMRWKRSPWLAALCILAVRAVAVQLGFFAHMQRAAAGAGAAAALAPTRPLAFAVAFMLAFSVVIALFKDIPDVKGDVQAGVRTFSVRHGAGAVFWACTALLLAAYAGGVAFAATSPVGWSRAAVAAAHAALAALLWRRGAVNTSRRQELADHYMFIWKLFYAEYLVLPLLR